jgi:DNA topoisomerase-1
MDITPTAGPAGTARAAGLRYVNDTLPGIRRRRTGKSFRYIGPDGAPVRDQRALERIKSLGIPPAWTQVWICPLPNGHIQATGRDAKGRKQYRYHPRWREIRDETKYTRLVAFGEALPRIRDQVERHMALPGLPREKVLATVVRLLEMTLIRVGNAEYARENHSFGLTTMRDKHVQIRGARLQFHFRGKGGRLHEVDLRDRRLARIVQRCKDIPGYELFQYLDDEGQRRTIDSSDVNAYLREISGQDFSAKDFRTWAGTVLALLALQEQGACAGPTQAKRRVAQAVKVVAEQLGNTPAICRKHYIHPLVIDAYIDGSLLPALAELCGQEEMLDRLRPEEITTLSFLRVRLSQEQAR